MIKKEQKFKNWTIQIHDTGSVTVLKDGEVCNVVKAELKTIAEENNWPVEAEWTTQELGKFTVDVLEMIENKAVKFDGRTTVDKLKRYFKCVYNVSLRVYDGKNLADDSKKLSELRTDGAKSTGSLECRANITVGSLIQRVKEQFGLDIKIATQDDWVLVLDGITLETSGKLPKQITVPQQKEFIAYQREEADEKIADKEETNHDGSFNLLEKLKTAFIIEDDDDVWYDAESADDEDKEEFVNNLLGICGNPGLIKLLKFDNAQALVDYLDNDPHDLNLAYGLITAAYMTKCGFDLDSRVCVDFKDYYFNDCMDFHYEYNTDIDWG